MVAADNAPVRFEMTAEDARLLSWCVGCALKRMQEISPGDHLGIDHIREIIKRQLAEQGNPHLNTTVEREYRRIMSNAFRGFS